ncbi:MULTISPECIES: copper resistance protein B [unclassified Sphingomonas]|uniref:copper resistance protein B n=1 Tax=unclassified Sphingomonas TaxID=196159 RepID=UPI0006F37F28|nr:MULTISPECIES: copper resistance protein B [unclassified Sphingomonas]KQX24136.1 copper resistance protein CopB [Sphingomonas sp. Root1294]KQY69690.1 copper resistance protein CopB [Sphingomonas sp. Root50]KRB93436.1 copper resistance protein CopB [Sphingomonas sp. Root720]
MKRILLLALAPLAIPVPLAAQTMDHSTMPGMQMPTPKKPAAKPAPRRQPAAQPSQRRAAPRKPAPPPARAGHAGPARPAEAPAPATDPHAGHNMATMPGMTMPDAPAKAPAGQDMGAMPGMDMGAATSDQKAGGTALPPGNAPAPAPPTDHYADRSFPPGEMARVRADLYKEHGGGTFHQVMFNLAEYQARKGGDGFRWDGEAWLGGDINRLVLKSEGEGGFRGGVDSAEIQTLYSRAINPYWNVQAGVRHDFQPNPSRTYATIGIEGLAPYWFEVEGALFLSDKGDVLARAEGYYDQRITQRLILQPRVELNFAAQDVPENRIGSGLSNAELGLRLRYEIRREFAPYVGISYERKVGDTARYARADGEGTRSTSFVLGIRTWF